MTESNLTLPKRPAMIGASANWRREKHGDENVSAMDIGIKNILLSAEELNLMLEDKFAHAALFNEKANGLHEPNLKYFEAFIVKEKFEATLVSIEVGLKAQLIELENVKLKRVTLEPQTGGLTAMSILIQCHPDLEGNILQLLDRLDSDCAIEIHMGRVPAKAAKEQQSLPLIPEGGKTPPDGKKRGRSRSRGADSLN